jgi:FkbM family methyltransferase
VARNVTAKPGEKIIVDTLIRLARKLPSSWLLRATQLRFRYPRIEPLLEWCLERTLRNRNMVILRGAGRGLRFNCGHGPISFVFGTHELGMQRAFELLAGTGMTFYDVGANVGFYCVIVGRLVGPAGRVIAFEPLPDNATSIEHNARLNGFANVEARQEALGDDDGEARFLISASSGWGKLESAGAPPARMAGEVVVRLRRLDSLLKEGAIPPPNLMKIDIEGGEVGFLRGASETLRRCQPILAVDLHGTNAPVAALLEELGYSSIVLGSQKSIVESPWDACVIAWPTERDDLASALQELRTVSSAS